MGSVGVSNNEGLFSSTEVDKLISMRLADIGRKNSIVVFPNNWTSMKTILSKLQGYMKPEDAENASRGFAISMSHARRAQKMNFINDYRKNIEKAEKPNGSIQKAVDKAVRDARARAAREGKTLNPQTEAVIREVARTGAQRDLIAKMLKRDRSGRRYDSITTRKLTKADFQRVG